VETTLPWPSAHRPNTLANKSAGWVSRPKGLPLWSGEIELRQAGEEKKPGAELALAIYRASLARICANGSGLTPNRRA